MGEGLVPRHIRQQTPLVSLQQGLPVEHEDALEEHEGRRAQEVDGGNKLGFEQVSNQKNESLQIHGLQHRV